MNKILVVDDDKYIFSNIKQFFEKRGYESVWASTGTGALELCGSAAFDCVILDVGLNEESGLDICRAIRRVSSVPILFLSGFCTAADRIEGLLAGADDYIAKPFNLTELELRVRANIARRRGDEHTESLTFGELNLNYEKMELAYAGKAETLSSLEFELLAFLANHPDRAFSYEQLYDRVWNEPMNKGLHNLQSCMARVRQKLDELCPEKCYIENIRSYGYRFNSDGEAKRRGEE